MPSNITSEDADEEEGRQLAKRIIEEAGAEALGGDLDELPSWYDRKLMKRGQWYFYMNYFAMFVSMLTGLIAVLSIPTILQVLINTKQSSTPKTAYRRYMDTIFRMLSWYSSDFEDPNSEGRRMIRDVMRKHRHAAKSAGFISQKDMALTQFGFMGYAMVAAGELGLHGDQRGLVHLWRLVGHLLGIKQEYNLCGGSVGATRAACRYVAEAVYCGSLEKPPKDFGPTASSLVAGMRPLVPFLNEPAVLELTRRLTGLPHTQLSGLARFMLGYQLAVHKLLSYRVFAIVLLPILNFNMWLAIAIQKRFPCIARLYI